MSGALWYLIGRTTWNRVRRQLTRLRSPRYAFALLIGVVFLWVIFFSPDGGSPDPARVQIRSTLATAGAMLLFATWIWSWWRANFSLALAFQPAEVHTLFAAPLSRRALLAYKLVRSQILILINALIWMAWLRRWGVGVAAPLRFATAWGMFTLFSLHRFGVALVRVTPMTRGRKAVLTAARLVTLAAAATIAAAVLPSVTRLGALTPQQIFQAINAALQAAPASWVLAPFRLVVAPVLAESTASWTPAFAALLAMLVAGFLWVFSMHVEFEETAAMASAELAKRFAAFKRGGAVIPEKRKPSRSSRVWLPLAPHGHPALAIVWKNTIAWARYGGVRAAALLIGMAALMTAIFGAIPVSRVEAQTEVAALSLMPLFMIFGMSLVAGPRTLRNDLRTDLTSLPLLKTYPLPGTQIMLAEIASPALALTAFQMTLLLTALLMMPAVIRERLEAAPVALLLALAPIVLGAINSASLALQNATVMLFPGWSKLGPGEAGLEMIGQNVLLMIGQLFVLIVGLAPSAGVGGLVYLALDGVNPALALAAGVITGAAILLAGVVLLALALASMFERTEPAAVV